MVTAYHPRNGKHENNLLFDWQPVECFDHWSSLFMSALAKNKLRCVVFNMLQSVQLITVDVNEQRAAVVQQTENKQTKTRRLSSDFPRHEI